MIQNQQIKENSKKKTSLPLTKKILFIFIIIGAVVCSSAPFWHIYFKSDEIKTLVSEYKELNNKVTESNKVKSDLIGQLGKKPNDKLVLQNLIEAQKIYQENYDIAIEAYNNIKSKRASNRVLFFPNIEKLFYNVGIVIFLLYVSSSMFLFYRNRKSDDNLYLNSVKIKSGLILLGAIYFVSYILYPGDDFESITYIILGIVFVSIASYFSLLLSRYIRRLENEVDSANINVVRFIKLLGRVKNRYLFPFAKMALKSKESNKDSIDDKLSELDNEIEKTINSIA
ncbi:hypothetical protein [Aquimarina algiphila]|uniref:Uncharacterized protein n=1 Tax=Aquimarina algiphila TaxID=2047982 RepID=A0A554VBP9_9FLAO|nr:hypothetical protein [Aquimarina algiphila]TSE03967.1 hypothetical protein FOF46_27890 [Aquimarina algiphila]